MPSTTPKLLLPYPVPADTADVPRDVQALATRLDGILLPVLAGVFVCADGSIISGTGFTAANTAAGFYTVTITRAGFKCLAVIAGISGATGMVGDWTVFARNPTDTTIEINTRNTVTDPSGATNHNANAVNFIAIGKAP